MTIFRERFFITALFLLLATRVVMAGDAPYAQWPHSGSMYILTTPEGANLPATASTEGFPLLVRLDGDWFDFKVAQAQGGDIRFATPDGKPLPYQIDDWNAPGGKASIWVRIPVIKGNEHQEIRMFWGKADAAGESNGKAVFNESNGYVSVWHMDGALKDEVGTLKAKDLGTTAVAGVFGAARHFTEGKGINCGDNITTFPTGSNPHSTELWFKAEKSGDRIVCWGTGGPKMMVQMILGKPPHMVMDCYGSGASLSSKNTVGMNEWVHVIHTCAKGDSRLYVNGALDAFSTAENNPLDIKNPVKMSMGGWGNYVLKGDMDEVRVSNVARSADWVKLQYENQKPQQTVVGPLVQTGAEFSLSEKALTVNEGQKVVVTAKAGGAQKIYWIIKRNGQETLAAADRFHFTLDAGRVTADETLILQCRAVFANEVKSIDLPVTIKEFQPDPEYTLKAPANWDGRERIEIIPQISNVEVMRASGAGELKYEWALTGPATFKEKAPGSLILMRANNSGVLTVTAKVGNGEKPVTKSIQIAVREPAKDAWVQRTPGKDEKPVDNQFFARDDSGFGTVYYNGTLTDAADAVFLKLYADDKLITTESGKPNADKSYALAVKLKAGLTVYKVEFGTKNGDAEKVQQTVNNLVCGDAYIIEGQSNAVGYNYENTKLRQDLTHTDTPWIRSFGGNGEVDGAPTKGGWGNARVERIMPNDPDRIHFISAWGMALAKKIVEEQQIPVCILNGAVGGTRIDEHMPDHVRNAGQPNRERSIYKNLRQRVEAAGLTHGIRGVLWHQGEADQGFDGPDNCYGCETYPQYWLDLTAAWKRDYPNIQHYYVYQIYPNACSQGGTRNSDKLRDIQRCFAHIYSNLSVMPTLQIVSGKNCHFKTDDYEKMGHLMYPLLARDFYGKVYDQPVTAADLKRAYYTGDKRDEITLEFDQPMLWDDAVIAQFLLEGGTGKIISGTTVGNLIKLKLDVPTDAKTITYIVDKKWDPTKLLTGKNGIAALTFSEVTVESR